MPTQPQPVAQPRRTFATCEVCQRRTTIPADAEHCDFCHRNVPIGLTHSLSGTTGRDGRMKSVCDFCVETN